jgi:hypothetical protein
MVVDNFSGCCVTDQERETYAQAICLLADNVSPLGASQEDLQLMSEHMNACGLCKPRVDLLIKGLRRQNRPALVLVKK